MKTISKLYKRSAIYCILNTRNNKSYIGSAVNVYGRFHSHLSLLKDNKHKNIYLQRSFNKNNNDFIFIILEFVNDKNELINREQYYIDLFKSHCSLEGYNINPFASNCLGKKARSETIEKISGKNHWAYGKIFSKETKDKMSKSHINKIRPKYIGENITKAKYKITLQYDLNGNFIKEWPGAKIAEKELGLYNGSISACIKGFQKQTKGFKWKYAEK